MYDFPYESKLKETILRKNLKYASAIEMCIRDRLILLSPVFLILAIAIKADSPGPVFFRQIRVTQYGKKFRIFKFRTMVTDAEKLGTQVTTKGDPRITRVGRVTVSYTHLAGITPKDL